MSLSSRVLPPAEWPRLAGTEAAAVWAHLNPENTRVLVVEEDGEIVATWTMLRVVHAECLWANPAHRGFGVTKRLLGLMRETAREWGAPGKVLTGSISPQVTDLIERFGGEPMPCATYVLPVDGIGAGRTRDRARGRAFHEQLAAQVSEDQHPDDARHDEAVGRALRIAVEANQPQRAEEEYNTWAMKSGYEPVRFLGTIDGRLRADIKTAVIEVDREYSVDVIQEALCRQQRPQQSGRLSRPRSPRTPTSTLLT